MKLTKLPQLFVLLALTSCASTIASSPSPGPALYTQSQTVGLENSDRVARFQRLADLDGVQPPMIDQLVAPEGTAPTVDGPVPVVRVVFTDSVFFSSGSDVPLPQAAPVFDMIAQNMQKDVPDAALTILGHTDAVGSDLYNMDLSKRRALAVMQELADRGVDIAQMSTVAIGYHQPIAPNDTLQGRALNRRVEFLISANPDANLAVVQQRTTDKSFFKTSDGTYVLPKEASVAVLRATQLSGQGQKVQLSEVGPMEMHAPSELVEASLKPPPLLVERPLAPVVEVGTANSGNP